MATDYWKAGEEVHKMAETVLKSMWENDVSLGLLDPDDVVIIMRDGEMPPKWGLVPGKIKKVGKDLPILTDKKYNYKYLFEICGGTWNNMTDEQRRGLLCHLFCHVDVSENENSGEVNYKLKKPPIVAFPEELERHGMWWPSEEKDNVRSVLEGCLE